MSSSTSTRSRVCCKHASNSPTGTTNTTTSAGTQALATKPPANTLNTAPAPNPTDSQSDRTKNRGQARKGASRDFNSRRSGRDSRKMRLMLKVVMRVSCSGTSQQQVGLSGLDAGAAPSRERRMQVCAVRNDHSSHRKAVSPGPDEVSERKRMDCSPRYGSKWARLQKGWESTRCWGT